MRITERDIIAALQDDDDEISFEDTIEKVASAAEDVEETLNDEFGASLADLDDEEALEVLAEASGLSEEEVAEVYEAVADALMGDDDDEDDDEDDFDKEAAAEEMYSMGFAYGAGFNDALADGLEKEAAGAGDLIRERMSARKAAQRKDKFTMGGLKRAKRFAKGEQTRAAVKGMFSKGGAVKMKKSELKKAPGLARLIRKALLQKGGLSGKLSKGKAGVGIGAATLALGGGGYAASRRRKG